MPAAKTEWVPETATEARLAKELAIQGSEFERAADLRGREVELRKREKEVEREGVQLLWGDMLRLSPPPGSSTGEGGAWECDLTLLLRGEEVLGNGVGFTAPEAFALALESAARDVRVNAETFITADTATPTREEERMRRCSIERRGGLRGEA